MGGLGLEADARPSPAKMRVSEDPESLWSDSSDERIGNCVRLACCPASIRARGLTGAHTLASSYAPNEPVGGPQRALCRGRAACKTSLVASPRL